MRDVIQIAGIIDHAEAEMLVAEGVDWLGFPLRLPVHKEDLSEEDAARIIGRVEARARSVLITYLTDAAEVLAFCRQLGVRAVQLHGDIDAHEMARLRSLDSSLYVMKSIVVGHLDESAIENCIHAAAPHVDAFITDTFDPRTGAYGATGLTHDWSISRRIVEISPLPVMLAGGLNADNVGKAILEVMPSGVDAHTGVENSSGRKDAALVRRFAENARQAFRRAAERRA